MARRLRSVGKAIVYGVLIVLAFGSWSFIMFRVGYALHRHRTSQDGLMGIRGRALLQRAARIMGGIGISPSIDDPEILRPITRDAVDKWIIDYHEESRA